MRLRSTSSLENSFIWVDKGKHRWLGVR
jgi:hypothetical protein